MDPKQLRQLLDRVHAGNVSVDDALHELADLPFKDLGFARVDHHRHLRTGFPEVVLGLGKTAEQIGGDHGGARAHGRQRARDARRRRERRRGAAEVPGARHEKLARAIVVEQQPIADIGRGTVLIVSAGTSDLPVAEEAALTARLGGNRVERLVDVGVAGIHRLLGSSAALGGGQVIVVVAGMEGALPSVVAGLDVAAGGRGADLDWLWRELRRDCGAARACSIAARRE